VTTPHSGPHHHPSRDRLLEFATGVLSGHSALVVGAHLQACRACAGEVEANEAIGGALLSALPPAPMDEDALARALARIERPVPAPAPGPAAPVAFDWEIFPPPAVEAARKRRRWVAPGVWKAPVTGGAFGRRSYLLGIGRGISVPRHTHRGSEMVCVLKGAFEDRGIVYRPGDFCESGESVVHQPRVTMDGQCVCLIAVEASLVARDWVGRLFQPFVRI
jgi:putative transcriptional regulator